MKTEFALAGLLGVIAAGGCIALFAMLSVDHADAIPVESDLQTRSWTLPNGAEVVQFMPSDSFFCMVATRGEHGVAMVCAGAPVRPKEVSL